MGESSSKSVSSSQSIACSSESTETSKQPSLSMVSSPNIPLNSTSNTCGKTKVKLTLQDYRKQVGIRVLNLKPNQKIGISAKSESPLETETQPSPSKPQATALSPCPHCGYSNTCSTNKCQRCMRVFDKVKTEDSMSLDPLPEGNFTGISQMSKEPCNYGNRRPRVQSSQLSRQIRAKFEEPQCVTLSSDEDEDSFQESKRRKSDDPITLPEHSIPIESVESMQPNSYEAVDSSKCEKNSPVEEKKGEGLKDLDRWKDGGLKGSFFAVNCRSVRIGSYKFNPTGRVLFSTEGIMLEAPVANSSEESTSRKWINVAILSEHLLQVQVNFNRQLPVIFLDVSPAVCRIFSSKLGLCKSSGPYWDITSTDESQKRLTLLPCSLDDSAKNAIKQAFVPKGVFIEINNTEANRLLVISSPPEVRIALDRLPMTTAVSAETTTSVSSKTNTASKENICKIEKRQTRMASKSASRQSLLPVVPMFSWSDGPDRFSVTTEDYCCLNQDNLLNDSIIDFYVRYVFSTELDESVKSKCHVFSSFFYQRLTTRPPKLSGRKHPIEDDPSLTVKEKRHSRVQSWTKKVDIFEKDYLVIPINERAHWFLAIVCFPGLPGPVSVKDGKPIKLHPLKRLLKKTPSKSLNKLVTVAGESFHIGNTTITPINSNGKSTKIIPVTLSVDTDRDEAETDEEDVLSQLNSSHSVIEKSSEITEPIKQPCILFFDSLAGSSHYRVAATLREYLMVEYEKRRKPLEDSRDNENEHITKTTSELFSKETMISACLDVPQQNNSFDCGIYVLQYAESFMKKPFTDYNLPNLNLTNWFSSCVAGKKRKAIQLLLTQLTKETNPQADSVLDLLPKEDVEDVENVVSESNSEVSPTDDDVDFQDTITIKKDA